MTIAFWTLLIAIMLPWLMALIKKTRSGMHRRYDNRSPRLSEQNLEGVSQRVAWAEQNSYEILPAYTAAIVVSYLVGAQQNCIDIIALTFLVSRIVYCVCYIKNWSSSRSVAWVVGLLCILAIFATAAL